MLRHAALCVAMIGAGATIAVPIQPVPVCTRVAGGQLAWTVEKGQSLASLSSRAGIELKRLAASNGLRPGAAIKRGQALVIDNRHLVPDGPDSRLIVNIGQRRVFLIDGDEVRSYPAAVGQADWQTPTGPFTVVEREENPTWDVPPSIQEEMRSQGKPVRTKVLPGPANPLGRFYIRLSLDTVGIHGTNAPASIYRFATHGCIRLHPDDIAELFPLTSTGDRGVVLYEPVLLGEVDGRILLEAHEDTYGLVADGVARVRAAADLQGITGRIDWDAVQRTLALADGGLVDVTR